MENNLEKQRELAEQIHAKTQELTGLVAEAARLRMAVSVRVEVDQVRPSLTVTESITY